MIVGGLLSDAHALSILILWAFRGKSWRLPIALVGLYLMKEFVDATFKIEYAQEGFIWEFPGFYSLTVPYGLSNNTHFTVYVSLLIVTS